MGMKPRAAAPAADGALADRIRQALGPRPDLIEKRMFGGLCFMVRGHMTVGVARGDLMVRVGPEQYADALAQPDARPMDFTGKPLTGFVYARPRDNRRLDAWIERALRFVEAMPAK